MERRAAVQRLREYFAEHGEGLDCVYLYGSSARDEARADSDVDVAILRSGGSPSGLAGLPLDLEASLERVLGGPVDVVDITRVDLDLVHRILRDGILVHERDASARIAFEVRARAAYLDLRPVLDEYRREVSR